MIFDGYFKDDLRNYGTEYHDGERVFEGYFEDGHRSVGIEYHDGEKIFDGKYKDGYRSSGIEYKVPEWSFQNDQHNYGTEYHDGERVFEGYFEDGGHRYYGTEYHDVKEVFRGTYKNGQRDSGYEYSEDRRCELYVKHYDNSQRQNTGTLRYYENNEEKGTFVTIDLQNGRLVQPHEHDTSLVENLHNLEIQINGMSQDGLYMLTVYCLEGHQNAGYECKIATDEQGTIITSILKTPEGIFKGLIGEDYSMIEGNITNAKDTLSVITLNNGWSFTGTLDEKGIPYDGTLCILSGETNSTTMYVPVVQGQFIVNDPKKRIEIINRDLLSNSSVDKLNMSHELCCPIGGLVIIDPVRLISANGVSHHFERANLEKCLLLNHKNPLTNEKAIKKDIKPADPEFMEKRNKWEKVYFQQIIEELMKSFVVNNVKQQNVKQQILNSSVISVLYTT